MINERPQEAELEQVLTRTEKLANPAFVYLGVFLFFVVLSVVAVCVFPVAMLRRLWVVLFFVSLPISILGWTLLIKDCCRNRCTSLCWTRFYKNCERLFILLLVNI